MRHSEISGTLNDDDVPNPHIFVLDHHWREDLHELLHAARTFTSPALRLARGEHRWPAQLQLHSLAREQHLP